MCPLKDKLFREKHAPDSINSAPIACTSFITIINIPQSETTTSLHLILTIIQIEQLQEAARPENAKDQYAKAICTQFA